jgi:uncharacterized membrane protein HdeD (DUF308 family)
MAMHTESMPLNMFMGHDLNALTRNWWLILARGLVSIIFGVLAFIWPGLTLLALTLLYGAYALVDGIICLTAAITGSDKSTSTGWLVLVGILGVAVGVLTFAWPGISAFTLVVLIGAWALMIGIFEIAGAIRLRKEIEDEWLLILSGIISVLFGLAVLFAPGAGALALIWAIGAYAIAAGVLMAGFALRLRRRLASAGDVHASH